MTLPTNKIPLGDHCATAILLRDLGIRTESYPFDWVTFGEQLHDTNVRYNLSLIRTLLETKDPALVTRQFLGDALIRSNRQNTETTMWFPHETGTDDEILEKYERRFQRLYNAIITQANLFILVTRSVVLTEEDIDAALSILVPVSSDSKILIISGSDHPHLAASKYASRIIFKHIPYDISQFYSYDYTHFRPAMKRYLATLLNP